MAIQCVELVMQHTLEVNSAVILPFICTLRPVLVNLCVSLLSCASQLRAALFDVHDIFFVMPLADRLALLRQDRELQREKKLREMVS